MPDPYADKAVGHPARAGVRRVYAAPDAGDGRRVLVDRLWPRGLTRQAAAVDLWLRDIAPSQGLRRALHRHGMAFDAFRAAYLAELRTEPAAMAALERLRNLAGGGPLTLLYAARSEGGNHADLLANLLADHLKD